VSEKGLNQITARRVATELKSSVAPIYSYFESIEDLIDSVITYGQEKIFESCKKNYTKSKILNLGLGLVYFARNNKNLYRTIFMEGDQFNRVLKNLLELSQNELKKDERFKEMSEEIIKEIVFKLWIFVHGFASLICTGLIENTSNEDLIAQLNEFGDIIINHAFKKESKEYISINP